MLSGTLSHHSGQGADDRSHRPYLRRGDQRGCRILEIGTDEDDCDLFPKLVSQYAGFAGQFTGDLLDLAIRKRSDDINTFIFRKSISPLLR